MTDTYTKDFKYGGLDFKLEGSIDFKQIPHWSLQPAVLEYFSYLSGISYGEFYMRDIKQEVLDALSPFQLLSKLWVGSMLTSKHLPHWGMTYDPKRVLLIGSWLGQVYPILRCVAAPIWNRAEVQLIERDPASTFLAKKGISSICSADQNVRHLAKSVFDLPSPIAGDLVVWPGIEHFHPEQIQDWISGAEKDVVFVLQGTDMKATDHHNLVSSVNDLSQYFHEGRVLYQGSLSCSVGTRHMVAYKT